MKITAKIIGVVSGKRGTQKIRIPIGHCEIEDTKSINDVTVYWNQGGTALSAAIPISDYEQYCLSGDIKLKD